LKKRPRAAALQFLFFTIETNSRFANNQGTGHVKHHKK